MKTSELLTIIGVLNRNGFHVQIQPDLNEEECLMKTIEELRELEEMEDLEEISKYSPSPKMGEIPLVPLIPLTQGGFK